MEKQQLDRLLRIAKKTNSPVVVLDENAQELVILPIAAYEELLDSYLGEDAEDYDDLEEFDLGDDFEGFEELDEELEKSPLLDEVMISEDIETDQAVEPGFLNEPDRFGGLASVDHEKDIPEETQNFSEEQFYLEPIE